MSGRQQSMLSVVLGRPHEDRDTNIPFAAMSQRDSMPRGPYMSPVLCPLLPSLPGARARPTSLDFLVYHNNL